MIVVDSVKIHVEGKGLYENLLDDHGEENEWLDGVGLTDGCYCKHYMQARDWSNKKDLDSNGLPAMQHYCKKSKSFGGWANHCWTNCKCFEKGKSAGIKRILNQIRKRRIREGLMSPR